MSMPLPRRLLPGSPLILLAACCLGCGGETHIIAVHGQVRYDGNPIETGEIVFIPLDETEAPETGGPIRAGRYTLPADKGLLVGGSYRVEIRGLRPAARKVTNPLNPSGPKIEVMENYVPPAFNTQSTLTIEVSADNADLDWDLPAGP